VELQPGENKNLFTLLFKGSDLAFVGAADGKWVLEKGDFPYAER
jgi:hypothetical protein